MGLDMYLEKRTYVQRWDHHSEDKKFEVTVKRGGKPYRPIKMDRVSYVIEEVAYWRKANAIHRWFVENCQGGVDECQKSYVTVEQLTELRDLCVNVLNSLETVDGDVDVGTSYHADGRVEHHTRPGKVVAQKGIADRELPAQSGFFFGSTNYDEYYVADLQETVEMLTKILEEDNTYGEFYYQSSW